MKHHETVKEWLRQDSYRMEALLIASELKLNDWCLAAGFVRNLIWDKLHGKPEPTQLNDIDLIYYSEHDCSEATEREFENRLKRLSNHPWSVKNQARMHFRNNDLPYKSTSDAMSYWVEVETAVGARYSKNEGIEIVAPFGLKANFDFTVTLNPKRQKRREFNERVKGKDWLLLWPKLEIAR